MRKLASAILILLLSAVAALGQGKASVSGRVFNGKASGPLPDAHVAIPALGISAICNASGQYELTEVPPGNYILRFSYIGFAADSVAVRLQAGEALRVNGTLFPAPYAVPEVVVTATRTQRPASTVPARIEVIGNRDIEETPMLTTDDLLNLSPGVHAGRQFGIYNKNTEVTMRGLNRNVYTLLLIDGLPQSLLDGSSANWNRIDPDMIDHIEIVKGPNSSLYGGNALGGVVNIITRKPTEPFSGSISTSYGTYNTLGGKAMLSGRTGKENKKYFFGIANGSLRQSEGYIMDPDSLMDSTEDKLYVYEYNAGFKGGYAISDRESVEAEYRYSYDLRGAGKIIYENGGNFNKYINHFARARYSRISARSQVEADIFWKQENYLRQFENLKSTGTYIFYHTHSQTRDQGLWFSWSKVLPANQELTIGADLRVGTNESKDVYHTSSDTVHYGGDMGFYGIFVQDHIALAKGRLNIAAGLRFDGVTFSNGHFLITDPSIVTENLMPFTGKFNDTSWFALSPRLGLQWNFSKDNRIFVSWSEGFRPSTLSDLCRSGYVNKGFKLANPGLAPETLDNFDLGLVLGLKDKLSVEPVFFYSIGHNFQYYTGLNDSVDTAGYFMDPVIRRENIGEVHIYGGEMKVSWQINSHLDLLLAYSYNHSVIREYQPGSYSVNDLTGRSLTESPDHIIFGRFHWRNRFLNITVSGRYSGREYTDDENTQSIRQGFLLDLKLYRTILRRFSLSLTVQNVLDNRFTDSRGYLSPGRFILGEVTANF